MSIRMPTGGRLETGAMRGVGLRLETELTGLLSSVCLLAGVEEPQVCFSKLILWICQLMKYRKTTLYLIHILAKHNLV